MINKLTREEFYKILNSLSIKEDYKLEYLFETYESIFEGLTDISNSKEAGDSFEVNSSNIIFYLLGEFLYSVSGMSEEQIAEFVENEKYQESMVGVVADKYISLSLVYSCNCSLFHSIVP